MTDGERKEPRIDERRIDAETLASIMQGVEERAKEKPPQVEIELGLVVGALTLLKMEDEEPGLLPEQLRDDLRRDVAHIRAARMGMLPVLVDGEERFVPLAVLEGPYPGNFDALEAHARWCEWMAERHWKEAQEAQFAVDVFEDLERLDTAEEE